MEAKVYTIEFKAGFNGARIDAMEGVIRGVSVITAGVQARGHDLWTDGTTLLQMKQCADRKGGRIPVKENHKSGVEAVCGYLANFEVDGSRLRADLYLLKSHPRREQYIEAAERMPEGLGLSAAFEPPTGDSFVAGKKMARCEDLLAVDLVTMPAANPSGIFSAKTVDTLNSAMTAPTNQPAQTVEQMLAALTQSVAELKTSLDTISSKVDGMEAAGQDDEPLSIEELAQIAEMDDAKLQELGLTREEVDAAVEQAVAALGEQADAQNGEGQEQDGAEQVVAEGAAAPVAAGAGATGLEALQKQVTELRSKIEAKDAAEQEDAVTTMLSSIETAAKTLAAENQALRTQLEKRSGAPASAGSRAAIGFEKGGSAKDNTFEGKVQVLMSQGKARNVALLESIRQFPELHRQWRAESQGSRVTNL